MTMRRRAGHRKQNIPCIFIELSPHNHFAFGTYVFIFCMKTVGKLIKGF